MTYQQAKRFIAHAPKGLTATEKLTGHYLASEQREKTGSYSISVRRLSEILDISPSTIKRSLKKLENLGLFTIENSPLITYARTFRLALPCPEGCDQLPEHHTKTELEKILEMANRVKMNQISGQNEPPYIDIKEEDIETLGLEELGIVKQVLEDLPELNQAQQEIKKALTTSPKQLAKTLLEITAKAGNKKAYLAKVISATPQQLLKDLDKSKAITEGQDLISDSKEDHLDQPEGYKPAHTKKRLEAFIETTGRKTKINPYLEDLALAGKLTEHHLDINEAIKAFIDKTFNAEEIKSLGLLNEVSIGSCRETLMPSLIATERFIYAMRNLPEATIKNFLETDQELNAWNKREKDLQQLKETWINQNPDTPEQFGRSLERGRFLKDNPLPITEPEIAKRFLGLLNREITTLTRQYLRNHREEKPATYIQYLVSNYGLIQDLNEITYWIPERPEGHRSHLRKVEKEYRTLRQKLTHQEIVSCLNERGNITSKPEGNQYAVSPEKYLADKCRHLFRSKETKTLEALKV